MITAERLASEEARKDPWCLKITEKVSINIASEASFVHNLSGKKFEKKIFFATIWKTEACGQTLLPESSILIG